MIGKSLMSPYIPADDRLHCDEAPANIIVHEREPKTHIGRGSATVLHIHFHYVDTYVQVLHHTPRRDAPR
jgi:hypothetical protein